MQAVDEARGAATDEALSAWFLGESHSCCGEGDIMELGPDHMGASRFCRENENCVTAEFGEADWAVLRKQHAKCFRFVHLNGILPYEDLLAAIEASRTLLRPHGIIALSDYQKGNNPGSAAAVWNAVLTGTLRPICTTKRRFYGLWGDPGPIQEELLVWMASYDSGFAAEVHVIAGHRLLHFNIT
ncbi:hypothetical protein ACSNOI_14125 [Actinomadura kijaniata]|uniref:hypothetical protein n=1 Tax=Actinomadura kijaniata TaxID=46161 RepID=UPI003F1DBEB0